MVIRGIPSIDLIFREQQNGIDLLLGVPLRFGMAPGIVGSEHSAEYGQAIHDALTS